MPAINIIEVQPPDTLADYVDAFWHCQIRSPGVIRLLPTACSELMAYHKLYLSGLSFIGPMGKSQMTQVRAGEVYAGARLKAGTKALFREKSYQALKDSKLRSYEMLDPAMKAFEVTMPYLLTFEALEESLKALVITLIDRQQLVRDPLVDQFIALSESCQGLMKAEEVMLRVPMSPRHFRRRFADFTGFTPKEFLRLCRHQMAVLDLKRKTRTVTEVAAMNGYTDHAHFTNEFQQLVGVTPISFENELTLK
ncbi:MAG: helix-turn-helix transcriptional regulator [Anaerolineae bacterium]|nr:helix-turn-helix transcriptional regulator [Anaerolineae bacterium]